MRKVLFLTFVTWYKNNKKHSHKSLDKGLHYEEFENSTNHKFDLERIISLINDLPEEKQTIVKLRFWEELKFSEIAEKLNKSEDAIKKMFYRTIEELSKKVG